MSENPYQPPQDAGQAQPPPPTQGQAGLVLLLLLAAICGLLFWMLLV